MLRPAGLSAVGRRASRSQRSRLAGRGSFLTVAPSSRADSPTLWGWPPWLSPVYRAEGQRSRSGAHTMEFHA